MRPIVRASAWLKPWYEPVDRGYRFSPTEALVPTRLNELLVADITYVAVAIGFVYLPAILCLVAPRCGLHLGPTSMRDSHRQCSKLRSRPSSRRPAAPIIPTAARSTMPSTIVPNLRAELLDVSDGALNPRASRPLVLSGFSSSCRIAMELPTGTQRDSGLHSSIRPARVAIQAPPGRAKSKSGRLKRPDRHLPGRGVSSPAG